MQFSVSSKLQQCCTPRILFLIDGFGAMLSAFLLGVVLVQFEPFFGIPRSTLYFLASLPCVFAVYDFSCYLSLRKNLSPFLKAIAIANLFYCCLSLGLAIYHRQVLTISGWIYILVEIGIVIFLATVELRIAANVDVTQKMSS